MICQKCGLPKELCVCEEISREEQKIRVRVDKRRYGKVVTIVDGFQNVDIDKIATELKKKLACGGTSKNGQIELQGDHSHKVKDVLVSIGFSENSISVL
ncbi:MAG: translation initiation factor [Candidatus Altiarchaeota archaeon]